MFEITYRPTEEKKKSNMKLHLTQRNVRGGSIGDVVILGDGETAEVTIGDTSGVQITAVEMVNVPSSIKPGAEVTPPSSEDEPQPEAGRNEEESE